MWENEVREGSDGKVDISVNTSKYSHVLAQIFITWRTYYTWGNLLLKKKSSKKNFKKEKKLQLIFSHKVDFHSNAKLNLVFSWN